MDADYKERMDRAREAESRMTLKARASSQYGTLQYDRKRLRGMKRRQRLMVRRLLIARLERMAAKGIPIPNDVRIP